MKYCQKCWGKIRKIPKIIDPMKSIQSQSQNLTIFPYHILKIILQSYNLTILQSYSLTILLTVSQSHIPTISQSHNLTIFPCQILITILQSYNLIILQSHNLTILQSQNPTILQFHNPTIQQSHNLTHFQVWPLTYLLTNNVDTRDPIGSKNWSEIFWRKLTEYFISKKGSILVPEQLCFAVMCSSEGEICIFVKKLHFLGRKRHFFKRVILYKINQDIISRCWTKIIFS